MAHEITASDSLFSVREATWHGLGEVLTDYPTREQAQSIAHPWEPIPTTLYTQTATVTEAGELVSGFEPVPGHVAQVRSDNGATLGVVTDTYTTVTNDQLWDIAEAIQGSGTDVMYETAGSLSGGSKVWILLRLAEPLVVEGDPRGETVPYYALQNSHNGSGSLRGQATMTRIVCANTSQIADLDARARGTEFTFRHSSGINERIEAARQALAGWRAGLEDWKMLSEQMLTETVSERGVTEFLERFIPEPPAHVVSDRVRENISKARDEWRSAYNGITGEGIDGTVYGLVQASVEYAEHYRKAQSAESRFKRAFLDRNAVVQGAVALARESAHV